MEESLDQYREEIDAIDQELSQLFEKRMEVAKSIGLYKKQHQLPIFHAKREQEVIAKNTAKTKEDVKPYIEEIWQALMDISKQYQCDQIGLTEPPLSQIKPIKVGFQGVPGSFSEEALISYFGENKETRYYKTFEEVFGAIKFKEVTYGVLPIENTSTGSITKIYDLLHQYDLHIVGETKLKIEHHLLGLADSKIEEIKDIYSHPQGFEQSSDYLKTLTHCNHVYYHNTAISAKHVKDSGDLTKAAIGSARAAKIYGLDILKPIINNIGENYTRFVIIGKRLESNALSNKISMLFTLPNQAGSLYEALSTFSSNAINLIQIESRPVGDGSFNYLFYIDIDGSIQENKTQAVLNKVAEQVEGFRLLGCYKKNS